MFRKLLMFVLSSLMIPSIVAAQTRSDVAISGLGVYNRDSTGNGVTQIPTNSGGFLASYRLGFGTPTSSSTTASAAIRSITTTSSEPSPRSRPTYMKARPHTCFTSTADAVSIPSSSLVAAHWSSAPSAIQQTLF